MYYLQSRYYDPVIGRFISADIFPTTDPDGVLSCNMFAYCENNPVNGSDPSGALFFTLLGAITGFVSSGITAMLAGENGENVMRIAAAGALGGGIAGLGVDAGLFLLSSGFGIAAAATAYVLGGAGNVVSTWLSSDVTKTVVDPAQYLLSFALGGAYNLISFATGLETASKSVAVMFNKALSSFNSNLGIGLSISLATSFATAIGIQASTPQRSPSVQGASNTQRNNTPYNTWRIDRLQ